MAQLLSCKVKGYRKETTRMAGGGGWNTVFVLNFSPSASLVRVLRRMSDTVDSKSWAWEGVWDGETKMDGQTAMLCKGRILVVSAERGQRRRTKPLGWQRKEKPVKVTEAPPGGRGCRSQGGSCWGGSWVTLLKRSGLRMTSRVRDGHWQPGWARFHGVMGKAWQEDV